MNIIQTTENYHEVSESIEALVFKLESLRELELKTRKQVSYYKIKRKKMEVAAKATEKLLTKLNNEADIKYKADLIFNAVFMVFKLTKEEVTAKTHRMQVVFARNYICNKLKTSTSLTTSRIAEVVGYKEHSSVLHAIKTYNVDIDINEEYATKCMEADLILTGLKK